MSKGRTEDQQLLDEVLRLRESHARMVTRLALVTDENNTLRKGLNEIADRNDTRNNIYAELDIERHYQELVWGNSSSSGTPGNGDRTLDEFCLYMAGYSTDLMVEASHTDDVKKKLDIIRKITALGIAAMEQHGIVPRDMGSVVIESESPYDEVLEDEADEVLASEEDVEQFRQSEIETPEPNVAPAKDEPYDEWADLRGPLANLQARTKA